MIIDRRSPRVLFAAVAVFTVSALFAAQRPASTDAGQEIEALQLRPNFYMLAGAGGNIGVQIGPDGVVIVDTGTSEKAEAVIAAVKKLTGQPIRYVINTNAGADHVGGNQKVSQAGRTIFPGFAGGAGNAATQFANAMTNGGAATILSAENVLLRMTAATGNVSYPSAAWPTETFNGARKYMYFNREGIEVLHQPAAHSDADSVVFFRRSDIVVAGDILDTRHFPVIDIEAGGSIQGEIDALNRLVELAIPSIPLIWQEGGTYIIPGHGRVYDQTDVVEYRDMVTVIRDRIQNMIKEGMPLEQIRRASPTQGYTSRYGSDSGPWTTTMFIEAVYRSLTQKK